jgi:16S rRNA C967 or C1407 C5-methylase (RsmB/RsmF family)
MELIACPTKNSNYTSVPKAKKVVYSTCSIHPQENEHVVKTILASTDAFVLGPRSEAIPTWQRRGLVEECNGDKGRAIKTHARRRPLHTDPLPSIPRHR